MTRVKGTTHPIRQHISAPPLWTERNNGASVFLTLYTPDINCMIMLRRPLFTSFDAKLLSLDLDFNFNPICSSTISCIFPIWHQLDLYIM